MVGYRKTKTEVFNLDGFKCEICGGKIIMQANKTGVCQNCGIEYDIEAIRSMVIESLPFSPQKANQVATSSSSDNQNELDREVLITYLEDLRVLESILSENKNIQEQALSYVTQKSTELTNYKQYNSPIKPQAPQKINLLLWKPRIRLSLLITSIILAIVGVICFVSDNPFVILLQFFLFASAAVLFVIFALSLSFHCLRSANHNHKAKKDFKKRVSSVEENYKTNMNRYNSELEKYNNELSRREAEFNELNEVFLQKYGELLKEQEEFGELLEKAYSANIIPKPFRNIEGVYYLYDYISTSNQSLSEALTQANLDAIKQRLEAMIEVQSAQVIQQAQANAKLGTLQAQNEHIARLAEAVMNNTAVSAQYAQISAVNSELAVKLSKESLYYQKWSFILK